MLRNTYLFEKIMFTNKVKTASFGVGKEKRWCKLKELN